MSDEKDVVINNLVDYMPNEIELQLCPFCGKLPKITTSGEKILFYSVQCVNCASTAYSENIGDVINRWNARTSNWIKIESDDDLPKSESILQLIVSLRFGEKTWVESLRFYGGEWIDYHGHKLPSQVEILAYQEIAPYISS